MTVLSCRARKPSAAARRAVHSGCASDVAGKIEDLAEIVGEGDQDAAVLGQALSGVPRLIGDPRRCATGDDEHALHDAPPVISTVSGCFARLANVVEMIVRSTRSPSRTACRLLDP